MFTQRTHYNVTITYSKKLRFEQNEIFLKTNPRCTSGILIPPLWSLPFPTLTVCTDGQKSSRIIGFRFQMLVCTSCYGGNVSGQQQKHFSLLGSELHSSKKNYCIDHQR